MDLESGKLLWKAKNLPPDPQTLLQQPMWTTSIQFLHTPTSTTKSNGLTPLLATGTAYKQVQIYDIRTSSSTTTRRPVLYTPEQLLSHRITTLCQLPDGNTLAVGDSIGDCHLLDMRKMHSGKQFSAKFKNAKEEIGLGRLVGPGGSIRQLSMHPTLPYLACVGLDRKMWTWDVNRRKMMDCVYLRQRLNCLLFCDDESWTAGDDDDVYGDNEGTGSIGVKRERELEEEEDEVEDYVLESDDDDETGNNEVAMKHASHKKIANTASSSEEETASDSEDGDSGDAESDEESTSESEEDAVADHKKKRQKK